MRRAERFKRAYAPSWRLSNQKEYFVKTLIEATGLKVKFVGLGAGSRRYVKATGSLPDLAVLLGNDIIAYVEVTGANHFYDPPEIFVSLDKFRKYWEIAKHTPVFFVYLGFREGRLIWAGWLSYEDLYPYGEDPGSLRKLKPYGVEETFIATPRTAWRPLRTLLTELLSLSNSIYAR